MSLGAWGTIQSGGGNITVVS